MIASTFHTCNLYPREVSGLSGELCDCKSQNFDGTETAKSRSKNGMLRMDAHSENYGRKRNHSPRGFNFPALSARGVTNIPARVRILWCEGVA